MYKNIIIAISLVFGISGLIVALGKPSTKTMYIDTGKVYEAFQLSKELNAELETAFSKRKHFLDSLYKDILLRHEKIKSEKTKNPNETHYLKLLEEDYVRKQNLFESENQEAVAKSNEKIWKQINKYTEDYGKEMGYTYILGTTSQGNIMYAEHQNDISEALIIYINDRYNGKAK